MQHVALFLFCFLFQSLFSKKIIFDLNYNQGFSLDTFFITKYIKVVPCWWFSYRHVFQCVLTITNFILHVKAENQNLR